MERGVPSTFLARREITVREGGWVTDTILRCRVRNARQPLKNRAESAVRIVITAREPSFPQTFENPPYFSTPAFSFFPARVATCVIARNVSSIDGRLKLYKIVSFGFFLERGEIEFSWSG